MTRPGATSSRGCWVSASWRCGSNGAPSGISALMPTRSQRSGELGLDEADAPRQRGARRRPPAASAAASARSRLSSAGSSSFASLADPATPPRRRRRDGRACARCRSRRPSAGRGPGSRARPVPASSGDVRAVVDLRRRPADGLVADGSSAVGGGVRSGVPGRPRRPGRPRPRTAAAPARGRPAVVLIRAPWLAALVHDLGVDDVLLDDLGVRRPGRGTVRTPRRPARPAPSRTSPRRPCGRRLHRLGLGVDLGGVLGLSDSRTALMASSISVREDSSTASPRSLS